MANDDKTDQLIEKLNTALKNEKIELFNDGEVKTIREMIAFYTSMKAAGRVGIWARNFLLFIGSIVLIWSATNKWIVEFIKGASK